MSETSPKEKSIEEQNLWLAFALNAARGTGIVGEHTHERTSRVAQSSQRIADLMVEAFKNRFGDVGPDHRF